MSQRVSVAEAEDRLRRTLARRAGDVPPADGPVTLPDRPPELTLLEPPAPARFGPRRRLLAAVAAAACVAAAAAAGITLAGGSEKAEIMPAQESTTTATTAPPASLDPCPPAEVDTGLRPKAVTCYVQAGREPDDRVWLYAVFYPSPLMGTVLGPGDTRESVTGAEVPADLDTAWDYASRSVWLRYDDGVLGLHGGLVPEDEMVAMARSVHRTPGTAEFTMTQPPGWEPSG